jgi:two-component system cell cycle response regulator DivK
MFWWNKKESKTEKKQEEGPLHVLIIEDNPANHLLYRNAFETFGFEVTMLGSADGDFVQAVNDIKPSIISMDIRIGERNGLEAAKLLKQDDRTKDIPIMMLTNFSDSEKIAQAKKIGVTDYISLQAHAMNEVPIIFRRYFEDPENYIPSHPYLQQS